MDLLPCPFCGSAAETWVDRPAPGCKADTFGVRCSGSDCGPYPEILADTDARALVVAQWNRRVQPPA